MSSIRSRPRRGRRRRRPLLLGRRPAQREPDALCLGDGEGGGHAACRRRPAPPPTTPAATRTERARAALLEPDQRPDQPVLGTHGELQRQLDLAGHALDAAQQLVGGVEAQLVAALARGERHRVEQPDRARAGRERRLDDKHSGEVAALGRVVAPRPDRPVATLGVEDAGHDRGAVVARQAEPVDRAVARDQGCRIAVGQQPVVGDRREVIAARAAMGAIVAVLLVRGYDPRPVTRANLVR